MLAHRLRLSLLGFLVSTVICGAPARAAGPYEIIVERDVPAKMRDGVTLRADIYRPKAEGKFPVLLQRTPYDRSEEHTSELQSPCNLVCRLLLEKKKKQIFTRSISKLLDRI